MLIKIYYETINGFDHIVISQDRPDTLFRALGIAFCEIMEIEGKEVKVNIEYDDQDQGFCGLDFCQKHTAEYQGTTLNLFVPVAGGDKYKNYY